MGALISVGAGLLGTLMGAGIAWLAARRRDRLETAFALHREFHAPDMAHSRTLAGDTVQHPTFKDFDEMRTKLSTDTIQHVWIVLYFYQRLWLAITYDNIQKNYVSEMFGENFVWWYEKSYKAHLEPLEDWQARHHICELMKWITNEAGPDNMKRWRKRALEMDAPQP